MASRLKEKALHASEKLSSGPADQPARTVEELKNEKYLLQISAGPSYDETTHHPVIVNGNLATPFENEFMTGSIKVRIRNFRGLPLHAPGTSEYFDDSDRSKEQYSIGFSFVPKVDINAADTVWGNDFDNPVRDRLPPGFDLAVKIVKQFIDPTIELDAYADKPWMYAPAMPSFFAFRVGEKKGVEEWKKQGVPHVDDAEPLREGGDGDGADLRKELGMSDDRFTRRKNFRSPEEMQKLTFEAGRLYEADFFNPYIDFGSFALKLPGLSINCIKYVNDKSHKLRYVFKNTKTGDLYLCVTFTLLFGEDLQNALEKEGLRWAYADAHAHGSSLEAVDEEIRRTSVTPEPPSERPVPDVEKEYVAGAL